MCIRDSANTTFCLLLEPKDFERMFLYPASSRTIREGPPAMIPVPSGDVFNNTDAPPTVSYTHLDVYKRQVFLIHHK